MNGLPPHHIHSTYLYNYITLNDIFLTASHFFDNNAKYKTQLLMQATRLQASSWTVTRYSRAYSLKRAVFIFDFEEAPSLPRHFLKEVSRTHGILSIDSTHRD